MKQILSANNSLLRKALTIFTLLFFIYTLIYFKLIPLLKENLMDSSQHSIVQLPLVTPLPIGTMDSSYELVSYLHTRSISAPKNNFSQSSIPNTTFHVLGPIEISVSYTFSVHDPHKTGVAGLLLDNKFPYNDPSSRRLQFFYWEKTSELLMQFQHGDKSQYTTITPISSNTITLTFFISSNGKKVIVIMPDGKTLTVTLETSLYDTSNIFVTDIVLSPASKMTINKLSFRTAF